MHVPTEPGYPCGHRRLLKYCLDPAVTSWEKLYDMHFVKFEEDNFAVRKMGKSSFFKCMTAYHPEFRLKRVMEDACDTCCELRQMLKDKRHFYNRYLNKYNLVMTPPIHSQHASMGMDLILYQLCETFLQNVYYSVME